MAYSLAASTIALLRLAFSMPIIDPAGLTRGTEIVLGAIVLALNLAIYMRVFK